MCIRVMDALAQIIFKEDRMNGEATQISPKENKHSPKEGRVPAMVFMYDVQM